MSFEVMEVHSKKKHPKSLQDQTIINIQVMFPNCLSLSWTSGPKKASGDMGEALILVLLDQKHRRFMDTLMGHPAKS